MPSFSQYRNNKNKAPSIETCFGSHSCKGEGASKISEDKTPPHVVVSNNYDHEISEPKEEHIHQNVAPINSKSLSINELKSVKVYSDDSSKINKMLYNHDQNKPEGTESRHAQIIQAGHLDNAMNKHTTSEDMHVFTGVRLNPAAHFGSTNGEVNKSVQLHIPAFTSASTSLLSASAFARHVRDNPETAAKNLANHGMSTDSSRNKHVLKIHVPEGSHAMSLMEHSFAPDEKEILLHRGHTIEVHHVPEKINTDESGVHTYMWHAKIVNHKLTDLPKSPNTSEQ